jgi:hypothetical protein
MQNPSDVTTKAFEGLVGEVAIEIGVTDKRIYEILGRDNPYPKCWRLFNPLGRINPERLRLIRADFNARCDRILEPRRSAASVATLHKEVSEAITAILAKAGPAERRREITEAIAELQKQLELCD